MRTFLVFSVLCLFLVCPISSLFSQSVSGINAPYLDANGSYTGNGVIAGKSSWIRTAGSNTYYIYFNQDAGDNWIIDWSNTDIGDNVMFFISSSADLPPSSGYTSGYATGDPVLTGFVLPVELASFSATKIQQEILLKWNTSSEVNNYGFSVEKSPTSLNGWKEIGFVKGSGNSSSIKEYSFTDKEIGEKNYYRLKQIDNDGSFKYSKIVEVSSVMPDDFLLEQNYPNPFNPSTTIKYKLGSKQDVSLVVYDGLGNKIASLVNGVQDQGEYEINFNSQNLSSGIYYYTFTAGSYSTVKKMLLMK